MIKSTLMPAISPMNLGNDENKDVQWIQLLTGKGVFFFAIVYSRPSDTAGHKSILAHLKKMKARLELMGGVVIMGDLTLPGLVTIPLVYQVVPFGTGIPMVYQIFRVKSRFPVLGMGASQ